MRSSRFIAFLLGHSLLLGGCAHNVSLSRYQACERTVNLYARHLDLGVASDVAELFTEDAVWELDSTRLEGREQIRKHFAALDSDRNRASRHVHTNFVLDDIAGTDGTQTTTAMVYLTLYRGSRVGDKPAQLNAQPLFVGHYDDVYSFVDGTCLIKKRRVVPAFVRSDFGVEAAQPMRAPVFR